jgi:glutamate decarboxylase
MQDTTDKWNPDSRYSTRFQERCVSIIADLWNSPTSDPFGTATTGSSEAVMLGGLAMKSKWQRDNRENPEQRPNVIIGENAHLCVKKFADYFDVEARFIPVSERTNYSMSPEAVRRRIDGGTSEFSDYYQFRGMN